MLRGKPPTHRKGRLVLALRPSIGLMGKDLSSDVT